MKKVFTGVRLRRLREERGLTQAALARVLEISPSYLNQIEQNQRPLTVAVLLRISSVLGVDVQRFSDDDEGRLVAELRDVLGDAGLAAAVGESVSLAEIREIAGQMPALARTLLILDRRRREVEERLEVYAARLGEERGALPAAPMPYEEVRDFFY
ncbi:MAG TPA: helix-turn-helix transcriptional regulator, partial [Rhodocyclaceae bacterium]|nr:helix-turn-helix transcriptional regulator [Rhodocyclaceae bacterium]